MFMFYLGLEVLTVGARAPFCATVLLWPLPNYELRNSVCHDAKANNVDCFSTSRSVLRKRFPLLMGVLLCRKNARIEKDSPAHTSRCGSAAGAVSTWTSKVPEIVAALLIRYIGHSLGYFGGAGRHQARIFFLGWFLSDFES